jgi:acyl-CoA thioesterase
MAASSRFPFIEHVGLRIAEQRAGYSRCALTVAPHHFNGAGVVHGGVIFTLADTGMGAALIPMLHDGERCATVEIKINYFKPVLQGEMTCTTELVQRAKSLAWLESSVQVDGTLVARASGTYAVIRRASAAS